VCIAASSGIGPHAEGWPDALTAGPLCGRLSAARREQPVRALAPAEDADAVVAPVMPSHDAVPVLLVPANSDTPDPAVDSLLTSSFPPGSPWCHASAASDCLEPGFALVFGGEAAVTQPQLVQVSTRVGGDSSPPASDASLRGAFSTRLDLAPVYASLSAGAGGDSRVCVDRSGVARARWLALYGSDLLSYEAAVDFVGTSAYDGDVSVPLCAAYTSHGTDVVVGVSPSGTATMPIVLRTSDAQTLTMSGPMRHASPVSSGGDPGTSTGDGDTEWHYRDSPTDALTIRDHSQSTTVQQATIDVYLHRSTRTTFVGAIQLTTSSGHLITGAARGEALLRDGKWELAGRADVAGTAGGFRATLDPGSTVDNGDDAFTWQLDGSSP
jgi:hypothetical protein